MGVTTLGDTLGGYYYDLINKLASKHGRPLKFHPFTQLQTALTGLDEGRYRLVVSDIPITSELKTVTVSSRLVKSTARCLSNAATQPGRWNAPPSSTLQANM